ncbi:MAG: tRNA (guanine-N7)-methyltransferase, partial [Mycoplasmataceae bacterium]|nr:tRNA (guanine-N7)-methyltransferase [Mycoplasmataceae bacterium]
PWPKKRHEKFRLTNIKFLKLFKSLLKPNGIVEFKTDNQDLYNYSLESILNSKLFTISDKINNLYSDTKQLQDNVQTEYEKKFVVMNKLIFKLIFKSI